MPSPSPQPLDQWATASGRIVLLGDAAHPPVPYIGQGAMMAMEDVGTLSHLLRHYCCAGGTTAFDPSDANLAAATDLYQAMRIPRTRKVLGNSHKLGATQQRRAESFLYNLAREWSIRAQVCAPKSDDPNTSLQAQHEPPSPTRASEPST